MELSLENRILYSNSIYLEIENLKNMVQPIFRDVINNFTYEKIISKTLQPIYLDFNYEDISLENYYLVANKYNKRIDNLRQNILSYFMPSNISKNILQKFIYYNQYIFYYKSRKIVLHLFNDNIDFDFKLLTIMICKNIAFLEFAKSKRKDIVLYYIPTNFKKYFPKKNIIGPENVNSAFTSFNYDGSGDRIVIFRKEEAMKVSIHELVHFTKMDFSFKDQRDINKQVLKNYDINSNSKFINLFEAYTDSIAIIYNTIFNSILLGKSVSKLLNNELNYQYSTLCNILQFFKMEHILKDKNISGNKLMQRSNVLAYYFIKFGLLDNPDNFIKRFKLNTIWTKSKIREIYTLSLEVLKKKIFNIISINRDNSLRMTYNNILCI